ncbi:MULTISPECIES: hypothetical protein [unclassified Lysobacter]
MPAFKHDRQLQSSASGGLDWFGSEAGGGLPAAEAAAVKRVLDACPAMPWLWIGVPAAVPPVAGRRGIVLHRNQHDLVGTVRCALPLPLATETCGAVLLQHALDDGDGGLALLEECARVLAPGGTLWLATLNPWTPYRFRWMGTGLRARDPGRWQRVLRQTGFSGSSIRLQWLGPHWRVGTGETGVAAVDRFRAAMAFTVSKRVLASVTPTPLRQLRWQAGRWSESSPSGQTCPPCSVIMPR